MTRWTRAEAEAEGRGRGEAGWRVVGIRVFFISCVVFLCCVLFFVFLRARRSGMRLAGWLLVALLCDRSLTRHGRGELIGVMARGPDGRRQRQSSFDWLPTGARV
jgi:hypothetical protein